jgi:hypothetical protein
MKISDVIQIVKPQYVFLKLIPNNSIRNNSTHLVARTISSMYKNIFQSIKADQKKAIKLLGKEFFIGTKYSYKVPEKTSYFIYIEKKKIEFYFIVPKQYLSILKEKIGDVWANITIDEVDTLPVFADKATKYELVYEKEDAMSLKVDKRDNYLLQTNLNIVDVLEETDKVGIFYNFMPAIQESFKFSYKSTLEKVKKGLPTERNKMGAAYVFKLAIGVIDGLVKDVSEILAGKKENKGESLLENLVDRMQGGRKVSEATENKIRNQIIPTQIIVMSESQDKLREMNNGRSLANSFDVITDDNKLVPKRLPGKLDLMKYNLGAEINKISDGECQNFISIAGRELLERHNFMEKVSTQETQVPEDLQKGYMRIGVSTYRGHNQMAFLTTHKEYKNLSLLVIGPQRSGKTTLFGNLTKDAIDNGECVILFDFIENCEMSSQVAALFPEDKVLNIKCDNITKAQGLGYNEVRVSADPWTQYTNAKLQTTQLLDLINAVNSEDKRLAPKMERYLESAANVVFIQGGSIKEVFSVLTSHTKRHSFLSKIQKAHIQFLDEYIESLYELDETDKKTGKIIGTKFSSIVGIVDRLSKLKHNPYMELMLQKSTKNNIDLVSEMEKNQLICIKMPEDMFNTDTERDIYTTYWISKVWLALQIRASLIPDKDKRKTVNLIIDELYQVENTEAFLSKKMNRLSKFRLKPIVSCHYLGQLKHMKKELSGANASYMLLSGCDKDNFKELQDELRPFELESLLNLPQHHSLNLIKNKDGYGRFITKLPAPVTLINLKLESK